MGIVIFHEKKVSFYYSVAPNRLEQSVFDVPSGGC